MIIDEVLQYAREAISELGNHPPVLFAYGTTGKLIVPLMSLPDTSSQRIIALAGLGGQVAEKKSVGVLTDVLLTSEGWMSRLGNRQAPSVPPSLDPKRMEVLVISSLDVTENRQEARAYEIVRDSAKKLTRLSPVNQLNAASGFTPMLAAFVKGYYHKP